MNKKVKIIVLKRSYIFIALAIILTLVIIFLSLRSLSVNTMKYMDPVYKGAAKEKKIAFACNVVWGNEYLPDMMRIFRDNNIRISFFIGGHWAKDYGDLLKDIYKEGHEIGNHGHRHKKQSQLNTEQNIKEIVDAEAVIESSIGVKTKLFAPPYGDINSTVVKAAEGLGYKVIMWSIDTIDWNTKDFNKILERVEKKKHPGAIVLMHPTKVTVEALPGLIKKLVEDGYEIVSVSEVLE